MSTARKQNAARMIQQLSSRDSLIWLSVALAIHVVLLLGTSTTYIHDTWIDPKGAAERLAAAEKAQADAATAPATRAADTTKSVTAAPKAPAPTPVEAKDPPKEVIEKVMKNDSATPDEINKKTPNKVDDMMNNLR